MIVFVSSVKRTLNLHPAGRCNPLGIPTLESARSPGRGNHEQQASIEILLRFKKIGRETVKCTTMPGLAIKERPFQGAFAITASSTRCLFLQLPPLRLFSEKFFNADIQNEPITAKPPKSSR
jgi:hypothetical protein